MSQQLTKYSIDRPLTEAEEDELLERLTHEALWQLNPRQARFVTEYLKHFNATKAAEAAGYRSPGGTGAMIIKQASIQRALKMLIDLHVMHVEEVLAALASHARGTIAHFVRIDDDGIPRVDLSTPQAQENMHLIKSIKYTKDETISAIELHNPQTALIHISRIFGLVDQTINVNHAASWKDTLTKEGIDATTVVAALGEAIAGQLRPARNSSPVEPATGHSGSVDETSGGTTGGDVLGGTSPSQAQPRQG